MIPDRLAIVFAIGAVMLGACKRSSERTLKDTEGREIKASCDKAGACKLLLKSGERPEGQTKELALWSPGRLVGVCDVAPGKPPESPSDCRPITCSDDESCPPSHGLAHGTCINGLCVEPEHNEVSVEDAVMLCLSGTGVGTTKPDRLAIALNCGSPCKVPAVCRQP